MVNSPFGFGYLASQVAGNLGKTLQERTSPEYQAKLKGIQLTNEARERELTREKAMDTALSQQAPQQEEDLTPYDSMINNMKLQYKSLVDAGQGQAAQELAPKMLQAGLQRRAMLTGNAVKLAMYKDYAGAVKNAQAAGMDIVNISDGPVAKNPYTGAPEPTYLLKDKSGNERQLNHQQLLAIAQDPMSFAKDSLVEDRMMANLGLKASAEQRKRDELEAKRQDFENKWQWREKKLAQGERAIQAGIQKAQIAAGPNWARVKEQARQFNLRPEQAEFDYLTRDPESGGLGLDAQTAKATMEAHKANAKEGKSPEQLAGEATARAMAATMSTDPKVMGNLYNGFLDMFKNVPKPGSTTAPAALAQPSRPAAKKAAAPQSPRVDVAKERTLAAKAIASGKNADQVKKLFKDRTGQDY